VTWTFADREGLAAEGLTRVVVRRARGVVRFSVRGRGAFRVDPASIPLGVSARIGGAAAAADVALAVEAGGDRVVAR
jgi:hypothetical protein